MIRQRPSLRSSRQEGSAGAESDIMRAQHDLRVTVHTAQGSCEFDGFTAKGCRTLGGRHIATNRSDALGRTLLEQCLAAHCYIDWKVTR